jgi:cytochrome c oxidase assembly protein subunit 11
MSTAPASAANGKLKTGLAALAFAAGMLMLGYAAVPLYRMFCQATGYGGTPRRASERGQWHEGAGRSDHVDPLRCQHRPRHEMALPPRKTTQTVTIGERSMAFFEAENLTDQTITGAASYNISPDETARYFNKIQCFCFTRQTLRPHEKVRMPVTFFVDPKILEDKDVNDVRQITLSYTFHIAPPT